MASRNPKTPEVCPVCGEDVPAGALACPECGADHNSGWKSGSLVDDALDLPDESFDYEDFVAREFEGKSPAQRIHPLWWATAVILIVVLVLWLLARMIMG